MKSLYVISVEPHSGKTAACLALGKQLKTDGYRVHYMKPLSLQPYRVAGKLADEDAAFAKEVLGLDEEPWQLSPVVVTADVLRRHLAAPSEEDLMAKLKAECSQIIADCDVLLLEGAGSLREGYVMGLPPVAVAAELGSHVLALLRYHSEAQLLDDALAARARLGEVMVGALINRVPEEAQRFIQDLARPYLEMQGIPVFGV